MANVIEQIVRPGSFGAQIIEMTVRSNERGPQGEKGDAGTSATISAGNVYTINYDEKPSVINTGTKNAAVLDFYLPEGRPGAIHYFAGPGINITEDNRIEATGEATAYWGDLMGDIENQTDLMTALNSKQDNLTAGDNIGINNGVISATDTTYTAGDNIQINGTTISSTNTTYGNFIGSNGADAGVAGLVPAPGASANNSVLKGNGLWGTVSTSGIANGAVTTDKLSNGAVTASKLDLATVLDLFYPVGTYYETSDTSFDPNTSWGGSWQKDTAGTVTIAQNSGNFDTVGATGGAETHRHDFMIGLHRYYGAMIGDDFDDYSGAYSYSQGKYSKATNAEAARTTFRNKNLGDGMISFDEAIVTSLGDTDLGSSLPPYTVVIRWHRIA